MLAAGSGWAQSTNISTLFHSNFRKAEIFYKKLAYRNAIELYLRELEKKPANTMAKLRIADSYRVLENLSMAEEWYKKAFEEDIPNSYYMYDLAQILSSNEKYTEAREWYNKYRFEVQGDVRPKEKIAFIDNMDFYLRDSSLFYVDLANINSEHSDFGSIYFKGGIVFLSSRDQDLFIKHQSSSAQSKDESLLDMYYSEFDESNSLLTPEKFHKKLNSKFHEGPITFYENENKVAFTRNNYYQGKEIRSFDGTLMLSIYFAELNEEHELTKLTPFEYNNREYSTAHPNFSKDGKSLYFSSDLPGGFGGADLYVSHLENGKWGNPVNLGDKVNTAGDEMFPFTSDGKLYFSSDGHGGFGGLDIFVAIDQNGIFTNTNNFGFPINSPADDFAFIINEEGRKGLFSSNRKGGLGNDDIYNFTVRYFWVAGQVIELEEGYPIPDVEVTLLDSLGVQLNQTFTDSVGGFRLDIPLDTDYSIKVRKEGFSPMFERKISASHNEFDVDSTIIYMWAHDLFAKGIVYDNETQTKMHDVKVEIENITDNRKETTITDENGEYEFILQHGKVYQITASKRLFIPEQIKINTLNIKSGEILNDFILEEEFIGKGLIMFGFDKDEITDDHRNELEMVLNLARKYPETFLIIGAHADSRGSEKYNHALSERRANNTVKYFTSRGVAKSRIIARGFGESLHINRCEDGIHCHEDDHSKNRRAELKIERELPEEEKQ